MKRILAALCLLSSVTAAAAQAPIVPGRTLGRVALGMARAEVWQHLGKPSAIHFLHAAGRLYTWDEWEGRNGWEFVLLRRGRAVQIERDVSDAERWTFLFPNVRRRHPHLKISLYTEYEDNGSTIKADDIRQGIGWAVYIHHYKHYEFDTHLLDEIGPSRILIHRPGTALLTYPGEIPDQTDPSLGNLRAWFAAQPGQAHRPKN